jgi:hypothetical protein
MGEECSTHGRNAYNASVRKPERKRPLGRPRRRWEDGTRTYLSEIGWEGVDWIHVAQERDQWRAVINTPLVSYNTLARKPEGKRPLGRPRGRWEDSTRRNWVGRDGLVSCGSGKGSVAGCCEHDNEPLGFEKSV